jgi:uncharacterized protein (DUF302 family)
MQKTYIKIIVLCVSGFISLATHAAAGGMYKQVVDLPMDKAYPAIYEALEAARFGVVFEPNIGKNLHRFAEKWGDDYNRNDLTSIRSMVFCHVWYANAVSNADPDMLGLCPLRVGLYEKQGKTVVLFARPTVIAAQSNARAILQKVEDEVIAAIQSGAQAGARK